MIREKRDSRLTADISETAHELLRNAVIEFDSSKGKLVDKMIINFLGGKTEVKAKPEPKTEIAVIKKPVKRFVPPKFFDVDEYMRERMCSDPITQAEKFCDFYESNGWKVGKNKMKCWKASVRNWLKGYKKTTSLTVEHEKNLDDNSWANNLDDVL